ncbi:recombinase family protein [Acidobacteriota bacterium]
MTKRAAIYARYVRGNQYPDCLIAQIATCLKLAVHEGYVVAYENIFIDSFFHEKIYDYEGLLHILKSARSSSFDILLVDEIARLGPDKKAASAMLTKLRSTGVRIKPASEILNPKELESFYWVLCGYQEVEDSYTMQVLNNLMRISRMFNI